MGLSKLLSISPQDELVFLPASGLPATETIKLSNESHKPVLYKLQVSVVTRYGIKPSHQGILAAGASENIQITLKALENIDQLQGNDVLQILALAVGIHPQTTDVTSYWKAADKTNVETYKVNLALLTTQSISIVKYNTPIDARDQSQQNAHVSVKPLMHHNFINADRTVELVQHVIFQNITSSTIAFKMQASNTSRYKIRPLHQGVLKNYEYKELQIVAVDQVDISAMAHDVFQLQTLVLPSSATFDTSNIGTLWSKPGLRDMLCKLKIRSSVSLNVPDLLDSCKYGKMTDHPNSLPSADLLCGRLCAVLPSELRFTMSSSSCHLWIKNITNAIAAFRFTSTNELKFIPAKCGILNSGAFVRISVCLVSLDNCKSDSKTEIAVQSMVIAPDGIICLANEWDINDENVSTLYVDCYIGNTKPLIHGNAQRTVETNITDSLQLISAQTSNTEMTKTATVQQAPYLSLDPITTLNFSKETLSTNVVLKNVTPYLIGYKISTKHLQKFKFEKSCCGIIGASSVIKIYITYLDTKNIHMLQGAVFYVSALKLAPSKKCNLEELFQIKDRNEIQTYELISSVDYNTLQSNKTRVKGSAVLPSVNITDKPNDPYVLTGGDYNQDSLSISCNGSDALQPNLRVCTPDGTAYLQPLISNDPADTITIPEANNKMYKKMYCADLSLKNLTLEPVAFKIQSSDRDKYKIFPAYTGIIPVEQTITLQICLAKGNNAFSTDIAKPNDVFIIESVIASKDGMMVDDIKQLFQACDQSTVHRIKVNVECKNIQASISQEATSASLNTIFRSPAMWRGSYVSVDPAETLVFSLGKTALNATCDVSLQSIVSFPVAYRLGFTNNERYHVSPSHIGIINPGEDVKFKITLKRGFLIDVVTCDVFGLSFMKAPSSADRKTLSDLFKSSGNQVEYYRMQCSAENKTEVPETEGHCIEVAHERNFDPIHENSDCVVNFKCPATQDLGVDCTKSDKLYVDHKHLTLGLESTIQHELTSNRSSLTSDFSKLLQHLPGKLEYLSNAIITVITRCDQANSTLKCELTDKMHHIKKQISELEVLSNTMSATLNELSHNVLTLKEQAFEYESNTNCVRQEKKLKTVSDKLASLEITVMALQTKIENNSATTTFELNEHIDHLEKDVSTLLRSLHSCETSLGDLSGKFRVNVRTLELHQQKIESLFGMTEEIATLRQELSEHAVCIDDQSLKLQDVEKHVMAQESEANERYQKLSKMLVLVEKQINECNKTEGTGNENQIANLSVDMAILEEKMQNITNINTEVESLKLNYSSIHGQQESHVERILRQIEHIEKDLFNIKQHLHNCQEQLGNCHTNNVLVNQLSSDVIYIKQNFEVFMDKYHFSIDGDSDTKHNEYLVRLQTLERQVGTYATSINTGTDKMAALHNYVETELNLFQTKIKQLSHLHSFSQKVDAMNQRMDLELKTIAKNVDSLQQLSSTNCSEKCTINIARLEEEMRTLQKIVVEETAGIVDNNSKLQKDFQQIRKEFAILEDDNKCIAHLENSISTLQVEVSTLVVNFEKYTSRKDHCDNEVLGKIAFLEGEVLLTKKTYSDSERSFLLVAKIDERTAGCETQIEWLQRTIETTNATSLSCQDKIDKVLAIVEDHDARLQSYESGHKSTEARQKICAINEQNHAPDDTLSWNSSAIGIVFKKQKNFEDEIQKIINRVCSLENFSGSESMAASTTYKSDNKEDCDIFLGKVKGLETNLTTVKKFMDKTWQEQLKLKEQYAVLCKLISKSKLDAKQVVSNTDTGIQHNENNKMCDSTSTSYQQNNVENIVHEALSKIQVQFHTDIAKLQMDVTELTEKQIKFCTPDIECIKQQIRYFQREIKQQIVLIQDLEQKMKLHVSKEQDINETLNRCKELTEYHSKQSVRFNELCNDIKEKQHSLQSKQEKLFQYVSVFEEQFDDIGRVNRELTKTVNANKTDVAFCMGNVQNKIIDMEEDNTACKDLQYKLKEIHSSLMKRIRHLEEHGADIEIKMTKQLDAKVAELGRHGYNGNQDTDYVAQYQLADLQNIRTDVFKLQAQLMTLRKSQSNTDKKITHLQLELTSKLDKQISASNSIAKSVAKLNGTAKPNINRRNSDDKLKTLTKENASTKQIVSVVQLEVKKIESKLKNLSTLSSDIENLRMEVMKETHPSGLCRPVAQAKNSDVKKLESSLKDCTGSCRILSEKQSVHGEQIGKHEKRLLSLQSDIEHLSMMYDGQQKQLGDTEALIYQQQSGLDVLARNATSLQKTNVKQNEELNTHTSSPCGLCKDSSTPETINLPPGVNQLDFFTNEIKSIKEQLKAYFKKKVEERLNEQKSDFTHDIKALKEVLKAELLRNVSQKANKINLTSDMVAEIQSSLQKSIQDEIDNRISHEKAKLKQLRNELSDGIQSVLQTESADMNMSVNKEFRKMKEHIKNDLELFKKSAHRVEPDKMKCLSKSTNDQEKQIHLLKVFSFTMFGIIIVIIALLFHLLRRLAEYEELLNDYY